MSGKWNERGKMFEKGHFESCYAQEFEELVLNKLRLKVAPIR